MGVRGRTRSQAALPAASSDNGVWLSWTFQRAGQDAFRDGTADIGGQGRNRTTDTRIFSIWAGTFQEFSQDPIHLNHCIKAIERGLPDFPLLQLPCQVPIGYPACPPPERKHCRQASVSGRVEAGGHRSRSEFHVEALLGSNERARNQIHQTGNYFVDESNRWVTALRRIVSFGRPTALVRHYSAQNNSPRPSFDRYVVGVDVACATKRCLYFDGDSCITLMVTAVSPIAQPALPADCGFSAVPCEAGMSDRSHAVKPRHPRIATAMI